MRDPLQLKKTPYEVLGVAEDAGREEILAALRQGMSSGSSVQELTQAMKTLVKPDERAFVDIFLYEEDFIERLETPVGDNGSALISRRMKVAEAWGEEERDGFPHFASTHSLALLWYAWLLYSEEEQWCGCSDQPFEGRDFLDTCPPLSTLWSNTISRWVFLIKSDHFWEAWREARESGGVTYGKADIGSLRRRLESYFENLPSTLEAKYIKKGDKDTASKYAEYHFLYKTEMKTAQALVGEGLGLSRGGKTYPICCGKLMLDQLDLLGTIRKQLGNMLKENPGAEVLRNLHMHLSPHAEVGVYIESKRFEEARQALEALPKEEREGEEALSLLARSWLQEGRERFSLGEYEEALDCWQEALELGQLRQEVEETLVQECTARVVALQQGDPVRARKILEKALKIVDHPTLREHLSQIYMDRGIDRVVEVQKSIEDIDDMEKAKKKVEYGINDLEKAVELDPSNTRAADQLEAAKGFLANLEGGGVLIGHIEALSDVVGYMESKQWGKALDRLEEIIGDDPKNEEAKKLLNICVNNWAVQVQDDPGKAIDVIERGLKIYRDPELVKALSVAYMARGVERINKAQKRLEGKISASDIESAKREIRQGVEDLKKAVSLDSSNKTAKEQLKVAEQILSQFSLASLEDVVLHDPSTEYLQSGVKHINEAQSILQNTSNTARAKREFEQGLEDLTRAVKVNPSNTKAKEQLEIALRICIQVVNVCTVDINTMGDAANALNEAGWEFGKALAGTGATPSGGKGEKTGFFAKIGFHPWITLFTLIFLGNFIGWSINESAWCWIGTASFFIIAVIFIGGLIASIRWPWRDKT